METVAGGVAVGEDKGLGALALGPAAGELGSVPVDLVEEMGCVNPAGRAVAVGGELHVVLVVGEAGRGVPA